MRKRCSLAGSLAALLLLAGCAGKVELGGKTTVQVSASTATVRAEESAQLAASSSDGQPLIGVRWSVNGVPGGNAALGTIDAAGKYTAPAAIPANNHVSITAGSDQGSGSVELTLWNPVPVIGSVSSRDAGSGLELTIRGDKFVSGAKLNFGGTIYPTLFASRNEVRATVPATAATGSVEMAVSNPEPGAAFSATTMFTLHRPSRPSRGGTSNAAARFLTQASFGPKASEVAAINALRASLGTMQQAFSQYIDDQMNPAVTTPSTWNDWTTNNPVTFPTNANGQLCTNYMNCAQILWMQNALQGPDQLRQRTAFALSQIWVVSGNTVQLSDSYLTYYKILNDRAFGNYKDIMREVTLSSAMGYFLDMGNSAKAANGGIANENYAREFLQLFTVGLYKLNDDGTFQLDGNGQRIPTYSEEDVQQFARALTGWTYARNSGSPSWNQGFTNTSIGSTGTNRRAPMVAVESFHDTSAKTLLNYSGAPSVNLPGSNLAQDDLNAVLDNVFNHPNLPPFVSQLLIQHFTTSNPSPAYVGRVADVFRNNGQNVRGDMAAVVKAILLDPEARAGDIGPAKDEFGFLKEPVMFVAGIARSMGFIPSGTQTYTNGSLTVTNLGANLVTQARNMSQNVLLAPSVFNYYSPTYAIQGGTLYGPEFQLQTTANATTRANFADAVIRNQFINNSDLDFNPSITALANVAANAQQLVDQIDQQFMYGQMSASMKQTIVNRVAALPSATTNDRNFRAKTALYLTISSSQFQVVR